MQEVQVSTVLKPPQERVVPGNVSLYPSDWAVIRRVGKEAGQRERSASLRALIAELLKYRPDLADDAVGGTFAAHRSTPPG